MTIVYLAILQLIFTTLFVYGQYSTIAEECIPVYKLLNKEPTDNCCSEERIECEFGHIVGINMHHFQLTGSIPLELGNLSRLRKLNLSYNNLTGSIPKELGNLTQLRILCLFNNELTGSIPTELEKLSNLESLTLESNELSGSIPSELGNLTQLKELGLSNNTFTGSIPSKFGNLTNLQYLDLNNNTLSGSIPKEIGKLTQLQYLYLGFNELSGPIPKEFENLTLLKELGLSNNDFCGDVPELSIGIVETIGNQNLGKKCPDDDSQQNGGSNNESSKANEAQNGNNGGSQKTILIIVGVLAILLILIILAYFINKNKNNRNTNKNDNKINTNDESLLKINVHSSDMNNSHSGEKDLDNYTFIEEKYFEWKIENWDQLKEEEYSSLFDAHEHLWKLMLITDSFNEDNEESVDVGLSLCDNISDNEFIYANFVVYFRNYNNNQVYKSVKYGDNPTFYNAKTLTHGINDAILKSELYDIRKEGCSILENNKIIIGVLIKFYSAL